MPRYTNLDDIIDRLRRVNDSLEASLNRLASKPTRQFRIILDKSQLVAWLKDEPTFPRQVAHPTELTRNLSDEDLTEPKGVRFIKRPITFTRPAR